MRNKKRLDYKGGSVIYKQKTISIEKNKAIQKLNLIKIKKYNIIYM